MKSNFNIFALVVVKNEGDIIYDTIEAATLWADKIFIIDNMSTDNTWQQLEKLAERFNKVVLWGRYGGRFNEGLRQILYREYKNFANEDDWWCRLDGDEFYIDNPRVFLSEMSNSIDHVYNASFQYYFTEKDFENQFSADSERIQSYKNLQWYKCNHSEIRFVRNKLSICWTQEEGWPCNLLNASPLRIRLKHYQYRSLGQIKNRLIVRSKEVAGDVFKHEIVTEEKWYSRRGFAKPQDPIMRENRIVLTSDLKNSELYEFENANLPKIVHVSFKKRVKCFFVAFYMKYLNGFLFKL